VRWGRVEVLPISSCLSKEGQPLPPGESWHGACAVCAGVLQEEVRQADVCWRGEGGLCGAVRRAVYSMQFVKGWCSSAAAVRRQVQ